MDDTERKLRRIYISEAVSNIGSRMTGVALSYLLYRQTGRGSDLGLYYLLLTIPGVLFANPFGRVVDKFSRKSLLVYADATRAVIMLCMALFIPPSQVFWFFPLIFLGQIFRTLYEGAVTPLISDLISDEARLTKAIANLKIIFHASFILGLGVGGFVAFYLKAQYIFVIDAATFIFSAMLIRSVKIAGLPDADYSTVLREMFNWKYYARWFHLIFEGFQMVKVNAYRKTVLGMVFVREVAYGFLNPLQSLWPQVFFATIANSLGISHGMLGVGCVVGGIFASRFTAGRMRQKDFFFRLSIMLVAAELLAMIATYASRQFLVYSAASLMMTAFMNAFEVGIFAKYVATAENSQKGALIGFFQFVTRLSLTIGMGLYVLTADRIPTVYLPGIAIAVFGISVVILAVKRHSFQSA